MAQRRRPVRRARGGKKSRVRKSPAAKSREFELRRSARLVVLTLLAVALLSMLYLLMSRSEGSGKGEAEREASSQPTDVTATGTTPSSEIDASRRAGEAQEEPATYEVYASEPEPASAGAAGGQGSTSPSAQYPPQPLLPGGGARIALVIDDLGRSLADVDRLEGLGVPITYAVLPFESKTAQVTAKLRGLGAEILLHLPMEPGGGANPGPGALRASMTVDELALATRQALQAVPGAVGVNNHMGSRLTADAGAMTAILGELQGRSLFFLDSRTSAASTGYDIARSLGLASAQRQVFLDPDPSAEEIRYQFHRLLGLARQRGAAIAIGHPYPATFEVLASEVPRALDLGYEFVQASYLVDQPGGPPI